MGSAVIHTHAQLSPLFLLLADLDRSEGRPGGDEASSAFKQAAIDPMLANFDTAQEVPAEAILALKIDSHPQADIIGNALPYVVWFAPDQFIQNLSATKGASMRAIELIGPGGMINSGALRVGLYVQLPSFDYATRQHQAEETYITLGGESWWGAHNQEPSKRRTGEIIFHPSMIPHQNLTHEQPLIAAWRWSGNISMDEYYTD
jgi:hypothetical protein